MEKHIALTPESEKRIIIAEEVARILRESEPKIKAIWLFGSTVDNTATVDSDIDICVTFEGLGDREILFVGGKLSNNLSEKGYQTGSHVPMGFDFTYTQEKYLHNPENLPDFIRLRFQEITTTGKEI